MGEAHPRGPQLPLRDPRTGPREVHVEVHAVDARARIVLEPEVDVLADAEAEAALLAEVLFAELVLLHLQALLEDLLGLLPPDGDVAGDLLVTPDPEGTDGLAATGEDRLLLGELLQHLRRT